MPQSFIDPAGFTVTGTHAVVHLMENSSSHYCPKHAFLLLEELDGDRHQIRFIDFLPVNAGPRLLANARYEGRVNMKIFTPETYADDPEKPVEMTGRDYYYKKLKIIPNRRHSSHITVADANQLIQIVARQKDGLEVPPPFEAHGEGALTTGQGAHNCITWCLTTLNRVNPALRPPQGGCYSDYMKALFRHPEYDIPSTDAGMCIML